MSGHRHLRLLHLSDPHFGTVYPAVNAALLEAVRRATPDAVVVSGDITQRARASQFRAAREFLEALPAPTIVVPGNHDLPLFALPRRLLAPLGGFAKGLGRPAETVLDLGPASVAGLDSTSRWRHVQGALRAARLQRSGPWRADASLRIAVIHHPLDCRQAVDEKNLLRDGGDAVRELAGHQVDLVLSGHVHDPHVAISKRRYAFPHRAMVVSVAGTCLSWRTRKGAPNSFHQIDLDASAMTIERRDYDGRSFVAHSSPPARFARSDDGWTPLS